MVQIYAGNSLVESNPSGKTLQNYARLRSLSYQADHEQVTTKEFFYFPDYISLI
jgi:hypothetical protein